MKTRIRPRRYAPLLLLAAALAVPTASSAQGPVPADLAGRWVGSLDAGPQGTLRLVFEITVSGDSLSTVMYSPDQTDQALPTSGTTLADGTLTISVAAFSAGFSGTMNDEGGITGTWSQGPASFPLVLSRPEAGVEPVARPLRMKCPGLRGSL